MKIQTQSFCVLLLAVAAAPASLAQSNVARAELMQAATGEAFTLGSSQFRMAPSAVVKPAATATAGRELRAAGYTVDVRPSGSSKGAKTLTPASLADAGENLGVAVSASGGAVIVKPELNVYFTHVGVVAPLVEESGGTLLYSSEVGGKATIGFGSVDEAMAARQRMLGRAGVKEVAPVLLEQRQVAW